MHQKIKSLHGTDVSWSYGCRHTAVSNSRSCLVVLRILGKIMSLQLEVQTLLAKPLVLGKISLCLSLGWAEAPICKLTSHQMSSHPQALPGGHRVASCTPQDTARSLRDVLWCATLLSCMEECRSQWPDLLQETQLPTARTGLSTSTALEEAAISQHPHAFHCKTALPLIALYQVTVSNITEEAESWRELTYWQSLQITSKNDGC